MSKACVNCEVVYKNYFYCSWYPVIFPVPYSFMQSQEPLILIILVYSELLKKAHTLLSLSLFSCYSTGLGVCSHSLSVWPGTTYCMLQHKYHLLLEVFFDYPSQKQLFHWNYSNHSISIHYLLHGICANYIFIFACLKLLESRNCVFQIAFLVRCLHIAEMWPVASGRSFKYLHVTSEHTNCKSQRH